MTNSAWADTMTHLSDVDKARIAAMLLNDTTDSNAWDHFFDELDDKPHDELLSSAVGREERQ